MNFLRSIWFPVLLLLAVVIAVWTELDTTPSPTINRVTDTTVSVHRWQAPDTAALGDDSASALIKYGRDLIVNTSHYLGPRGRIASISNGMNCQNCHADAGTRLYANCLSAVAATYPQYRPRSGRIESIEFRVNDCMLRSLNGKVLDSLSREMRAMVAYLKWLGKEVPKGTRPAGAGTQDLALLDRPADMHRGQLIYESQCSRCHGNDGGGLISFDSVSYSYPPLWGKHSYNTGAGLYRLSKLSAYVRDNMPFGISTHENPQLSNEEAWDVAAFINSQPRPEKTFSHDWPKLSEKSFDFPFGPYTDSFPQTQHKFGPFAPIIAAKRALAKK